MISFTYQRYLQVSVLNTLESAPIALEAIRRSILLQTQAHTQRIHNIDIVATRVLHIARTRARRRDPGGKIIIAVRNKYGLKYWAGATDEYSGEMFDTIKGENALAKAYSLNNIKSVLENEGLNKLTFYYPLPDYIIPTEIFSDDFLPKSGDMHDIHNSFKHERYNLFSEAKAYESICKDGLFPQFANSYLIISEMEND